MFQGYVTNSLLKNRSVLVVGASSGIGAEVSMELARAGANVGLVARDKVALEKVVSGIRKAGGSAIASPADVCSSQSVNAAVQRVKQYFGDIDGVVYSAVQATNQVFLCEQTEFAWEKTLDVNLNGAFRTCRSVVPGMMERNSGSIVIISSIAGRRGLPSNTAYCASKFGLHGLVQALAAEVGPYGVRVNAVCPGIVEAPGSTDPTKYGTDFMESLAKFHGPKNLTWDRYLERAQKSVALRRMVTPKEVSNQILFLLSDLASGITGQQVGVDGGAI
jgi:hypothetical protein